MMDQVKKYSLLGLATQFVGQAQEDPSVTRGVLHGGYQLVFMSPEALIGCKHWQEMLLTRKYKDDLVALVVDEAHCVKTWGDSFRKEFARIGEIRSIIPVHTRIMALTATATESTRKHAISRLCLDDPVVVYVPPTKTNILYSVYQKSSLDTIVIKITEDLLKYKDQTDRVLIYCRRHLEVASFYEQFKKTLGASFTFPVGKAVLVKYRLVDMYTQCTEKDIKSQIVSQFTNPHSVLRVVIATTAFGMGIDCPNVRHIIHWGPPEDIESYVQQTGRAGRDGKLSWASLYFSLSDNKYTAKAMMGYCTNVLLCRRQLLFMDFCDDALLMSPISSCNCCDVCSKSCKCEKCVVSGQC